MMTVLITGASSGIGAGLAQSFARDGHHVIACGRDPARLEALHQHSSNITVRLFDMTDRDACRQALTGCAADLTILCAGTCEYLEHGVVDAALVERVMTTNFQGPVNCLAALQPQLVAGNRVVLVSSMAHWLTFPRAEAYGASKAALTVCAEPASRLGAKGIAVTVVSPGFVDTPLTRKNDFAMPGRVSVEEAVKAIRRGWKREKPHRVSSGIWSDAAAAFRAASVLTARTAAQDGALMKIAIIGSGIAGLTCAWRLAGHHEVTLFEAGATPAAIPPRLTCRRHRVPTPSTPVLSSTTTAPIHALWGCLASWALAGKKRR